MIYIYVFSIIFQESVMTSYARTGGRGWL